MRPSLAGKSLPCLATTVLTRLGFRWSTMKTSSKRALAWQAVDIDGEALEGIQKGVLAQGQVRPFTRGLEDQVFKVVMAPGQDPDGQNLGGQPCQEGQARHGRQKPHEPHSPRL